MLQMTKICDDKMIFFIVSVCGAEWIEVITEAITLINAYQMNSLFN